MKIAMYREQTWNYRENKLYINLPIQWGNNVKLENGNIIPQKRKTTQNHRNNNQRFEIPEATLGKHVVICEQKNARRVPFSRIIADRV